MKKRRKQRKRLPAYVRKVEYLYNVGALPRAGVSQLTVWHDGWCHHWQGESCNCNPDVKLRWSQPDAARN
jgi:hypothetical protein